MDSIRNALENLGLKVERVTEARIVATAIERTLTGLDQATADTLDQILEYWATENWGEYATYAVVSPTVIEVDLD